MKEIKVTITSKVLSRSYTIKVDDEFALVLERELASITDSYNNLDAKDLLNAFVKKSYEKFQQTKELDLLLQELKGKK
ncbi:MAG: hypothetical protein GX282_04080 [Campylobacteraceae bacterium]|nr:hypothetical protein [Campylobacteraceae bacterium]